MTVVRNTVRMRYIMLGVSSSVLALLGTPALAQEPADQLDEIVVTGQARAVQEAIAAKRETFQISDGVSSDDIGRLPDHNTAAALRRIPGVSVQEDQGEPRFPVLRGLPSTYNRTTIDGAVVASVGNGDRTVPLDIVPSTLARRLEVVKTVTPESDANAIGGTINILSRSAIDEGRPFFAGTAALGFYEQSGDQRDDKQSGRANFTAGTVFGDTDQFGVVLSASYYLRDSDIPQVEIASPSFREYTFAGAPANFGTGNGLLVPIQRRLFYYNNNRERVGGRLAFEWRPFDGLTLVAAGLYNSMKDDEERIESRYEQIGNVSGQQAGTGTFLQARNVLGLGRFQIDRSVWAGTLSADWEISDRLTWTGDFVYSGAELDNPESTEEFRTPDARANEFGFRYDTSGFFPRFDAINPAALGIAANYNFTNRSELLRSSQEDVYEARSDLTIRTDGFGDRLDLKVGGVIRSTERVFDQNTGSFTQQAGLNYTLAGVSQAGPTPLVQGLYPFGLRIDSEAAEAFFQANRARFTGTFNTLTADYEVTEDVYAGYGQATLGLGGLTIVGGVRYEATEVETSSVRINGATITPISSEGDYDHWLPSLHATWEIGEDLIVRGAWTNTIGRPNFSDITAREQINLTGTVPSLSRGNPNLEPRESEGFDLSIEYYIPRGILAVGVFSKDIENEIFSLNTVEQLDLGLGRGVETVNVSQPTNAETATIKGLELSYQQSLWFLPGWLDGFGVGANATFLDTEFRFRTPTGVRTTGFVLQPDQTYNAQVYYQKGGFESRLSYNYIGRFLEGANATTPPADQYWKSRGTFDAQLSYRVTEAVTVFVEGENLTDEGRREVTGPRADLLQESAEYGRVVWVGVSGRF
jgi:TonB-dependent receptor